MKRILRFNNVKSINSKVLKRLKYIFYVTFLLIGTRCSTDESLELKSSFEVPLKFQVGGIHQAFIAKFVYDKAAKQYVPDSELLVKVSAINEVTKERMYGYYLKSLKNQESSKVDQAAPYEIRVGYVGYNSSNGCWYYGTLYVDDEGESIFVAVTGMNAALNPPLCGYWYC